MPTCMSKPHSCTTERVHVALRLTITRCQSGCSRRASARTAASLLRLWHEPGLTHTSLPAIFHTWGWPQCCQHTRPGRGIDFSPLLLSPFFFLISQLLMCLWFQKERGPIPNLRWVKNTVYPQGRLFLCTFSGLIGWLNWMKWGGSGGRVLTLANTERKLQYAHHAIDDCSQSLFLASNTASNLCIERINLTFCEHSAVVYLSLAQRLEDGEQLT